MGLLDVISQMFANKPADKNQQTGKQTAPSKGGTTRDLAMRDAYLQYQLQMQELGEPPLPYDAWLASQQKKQ